MTTAADVPKTTRPTMLCVYCGTSEATTQDHVVPEGFFPRAPPEGYVLVPACERCNNGHSKDEEYVLAVLLAEGSIRSSDANAILDRWSEDHESGVRRRIGLARRLIDAVERFEIHNSAGIGGRVRLEVDRVNRVIEKIVRGLFFHEFRRRLPDTVTLYVEVKPELDRLRSKPMQALLTALMQRPKRLGDVFSWCVAIDSERPDFTLWAMAFYDSVLAIAVTGQTNPPD